jgi:hypothetical protein
MTSKNIPYTGWKIRLCFYGYGYRIIIDDWTLVTEVMMMVVPEAWENTNHV